MNHQKVRTTLDLVVTAAVVLVSAIWLMARFSPASPDPKTGVPIPSEPQSLLHAATKGSNTAPIVLIEFTDFECPYCGRFARDQMQQILKTYVESGQVQVAVRHLPLPMHPKAPSAAAAAECARRQGKFWEMHDELFRDGASREAVSITQAAKSLSLNMDDFDRCLSTEGPIAVKADADLAKKLGVSGTPSFLIGRRVDGDRVQVYTVFPGSLPIDGFREAFDSGLAKRADFQWLPVTVGLFSVGLIVLAVGAVAKRRKTLNQLAPSREV